MPWLKPIIGRLTVWHLYIFLLFLGGIIGYTISKNIYLTLISGFLLVLPTVLISFTSGNSDGPWVHISFLLCGFYYLIFENPNLLLVIFSAGSGTLDSHKLGMFLAGTTSIMGLLLTERFIGLWADRYDTIFNASFLLKLLFRYVLLTTYLNLVFHVVNQLFLR